MRNEILEPGRGSEMGGIGGGNGGNWGELVGGGKLGGGRGMGCRSIVKRDRWSR